MNGYGMTNPATRMHLAALFCMVVLTGALTGCGKKGGLEPPPSSAEEALDTQCAPKMNPDEMPLDAVHETGKTGMDNQMPDTKLPPC